MCSIFLQVRRELAQLEEERQKAKEELDMAKLKRKKQRESVEDGQQGPQSTITSPMDPKEGSSSPHRHRSASRRKRLTSSASENSDQGMCMQRMEPETLKASLKGEAVTLEKLMRLGGNSLGGSVYMAVLKPHNQIVAVARMAIQGSRRWQEDPEGRAAFPRSQSLAQTVCLHRTGDDLTTTYYT
jgi:hypothetical protein